MFQDPVLIWEMVDTLRHLMSSLDTCLEKEVNQMKVAAGMGVPLFTTLHMKGNGCRRGIGTGILTSRVPGSVVRGKRLASYDMMAEGTMGEVGVVFERHVDG